LAICFTDTDGAVSVELITNLFYSMRYPLTQAIDTVGRVTIKPCNPLILLPRTVLQGLPVSKA